MDMHRFLLAVFCLWFPMMAVGSSVVGKEEAGEYPARVLRLDIESPGHQSMMTPVATYVNDAGQEIVLFGAVHVAESEYYGLLNGLFQDCDLLLFEMIGGEYLGRQMELGYRIDWSKPLGGLSLKEAREWNNLMKRSQQDEGRSILMRLLNVFYQEMSRVLDLQTQGAGIDYSPAHFVHADMTLTEFEEAQKQRGESLGQWFIKSLLSSMSGQTEKYEPNELQMIKDFFTDNTNGLKNELMRMFVYSPLAVEDTVILEGRNAKCCAVLDEWRQKDYDRIGIFYGAAHLPGLHQELLKRGYRLNKVDWLVAWITKKEAGKLPAAD